MKKTIFVIIALLSLICVHCCAQNKGDVVKRVLDEAGWGYVDFNLPSGTKWAYGNFYYRNSSINTAKSKRMYDCSKQIKELMGEPWDIPTVEQWDELFKYTTQQWTVVNGMEGVLVSQGHKYIFLAAPSIEGDTNVGYYWTKSTELKKNLKALRMSIGESGEDYAIGLNIFKDGETLGAASLLDYYKKSNHFIVRPVRY